MVHQMFPVLLALHAGVIVSTFEITSHDPRTKPDSGLQGPNSISKSTFKTT